MIDRFFQPLALPLTPEQLHRLPRHSAYDHQHKDGAAWLQPRPSFVQTVLPLDRAPRPANPVLPLASIRPLHPEDWRRLPALFTSAFERVPPFCTLPLRERPGAARRSLRRVRKSLDGALLPSACFVAARPIGDERELCGAALVIRRDFPVAHPYLSWISVHPWLARQGLGRELLAQVACTLRSQGETELRSSILFGHGASMLWHWRQGFQYLSIR